MSRDEMSATQREPNLVSGSFPISDEWTVAIVPPGEHASIGEKMRNRRIHRTTIINIEGGIASTGPDDPDEILEPILVRSPPKNMMDKFITVQKWSGTIVDVSDTEFTAILEDLTASSPRAEALFSLDQVLDKDRNEIEKGQMIAWYIGYSLSRDGQRRASDIVVFIDLPERSDEHLHAVRETAEKYFSGLFNASE